MKFTTAVALFLGVAAAAPNAKQILAVRDAMASHNPLAPRDACDDNPFSACTYRQDDGSCEDGYLGCILKMGCNDCPGGETGCAGCALGCVYVCNY